MDGEGKIQGKLQICYCNVFQNPRRQTACSTLNDPTNVFSFALFLIGFTVQNAEVCFAFFQKFQTATLRGMGVLGSCVFQDSN